MTYKYIIIFLVNYCLHIRFQHCIGILYLFVSIMYLGNGNLYNNNFFFAPLQQLMFYYNNIFMWCEPNSHSSTRSNLCRRHFNRVNGVSRTLVVHSVILLFNRPYRGKIFKRCTKWYYCIRAARNFHGRFVHFCWYKWCVCEQHRTI